MDEAGKIMQLQGRLGGKSRALKKAEAKIKYLEGVIEKATKIADDHRDICNKLSSHRGGCDKCVAKDSCWEVDLRDVLKG